MRQLLITSCIGLVLLGGTAPLAQAQNCADWLERDLSVGEVLSLRSRALTLVVRGSHSYLWRYLVDESGVRGWLQTTGSVSAEPGDELILVAENGTTRTFPLTQPLDMGKESAKTLAFSLANADLNWLRTVRITLFKWKSLSLLEIREYRLSELRREEFFRLTNCVASRIKGLSGPARDSTTVRPSGESGGLTTKGGNVDLREDYARAAEIKARLAREVAEARAAAEAQQSAFAQNVREAKQRSDERLAAINDREIERIRAARLRADSVLQSLTATVESARAAARTQLEADQTALAESMAQLRRRNEEERIRMQDDLARARNDYAAAVQGARQRAEQALAELGEVENLSQEERSRRLSMIQTETDRALILAEAQRLAAEDVAETRRRALQAVTDAQEKADARLKTLERHTASRTEESIAQLEKTLQATAAAEAAALSRAQTAEAEAEARITRARLRAEQEIEFLRQQVAEALAARDAATAETVTSEFAEARLIEIERKVRASEAELDRLRAEITEARRLLQALRNGNR